MNDVAWPHWVGRREQIALDSLIRFANAIRIGDPLRNVATRDMVRAIGFQDRNSVGVIADLIERTLAERINS